MPWCGQRRRMQTEPAGFFEMQPPSRKKLALGAHAVHLSQQRERLPVTAEQDVLSVVDDSLPQLDSSRAAAQLRRRFEDGHRASRGGERDRGRES